MKKHQIYIALLTAYMMGQEAGGLIIIGIQPLSTYDVMKNLREMAEKLEKEV